MTDKPTTEQIQRACDLAKEKDRSDLIAHVPSEYGAVGAGCLKVLADTIAQLDAMQAERDKVRADLGEIDRIVVDEPWIDKVDCLNSIAAITARYRAETDPLTAALRHAFGAAAPEFVEAARDHLKSAGYEVAKRGLEIGRSA